MPPDEDGEGQGQGLAMLRLEARRYKREMQQIWMQRQLHEQKKTTASFSSEDSSRIPDRWRFSETFTTSPATSGTPIFWNREDVAVSHLKQLAIVEEGTQTDNPSKSEVHTETEKLQYDAALVLNKRESRAMSSAANDLLMQKICSRHCDELRSRISQEAACECLADAAVRVNADVVFTAKPKRVAVEGQVETPEFNYSRVFRPDENGTVSHISTIATSLTGSLNKGQKSTDPGQYFRTGLRGLVSPVPQHDSACSPIHNLHDYGARFRSLRDISKDTTPTEMFSWQQDRSEPEKCSSVPPPTFSTQVSTPQPEASCGGTKAGDNTSDFSTEISGSKRVRTELTGEGAMAARLATRIKHALEAIGGKADTRSTNSTFKLPGRAIQSISDCRLRHKDECSEMKLFEDAGEKFGGRTLNNKEVASSDSSLPIASQHARRVPVSSSQNHSSGIPGSDADVYFQNVMAALSTDRYDSNKFSGSCTAGEVSPARAVRRAERRAEAARRANIKSCGDHHASHQPGGIKNSVKNDVRQSGSKHVREKQRLLSNVQKLQSVAESAKKLYTDLVNCAYDELRASTDCGNLVKRQDGDSARDVCKSAKPINEICPSIEKTSDSRKGVASSGNDEVCGRCHVCRPQFNSRENHQECMEDTAPSTYRDSWPCDIEQPREVAQTDSLDEITIQLSDDSPTNIKLSKNDCSNRPGYNVEISTPYESPCQRECSPNSRGEDTVRRGTASWKDSCKPAMRVTGSNQQVKKCSNKCLLDPLCDGPQDSCHMPTRVKCSRASTVSVSQTPKKDSNRCLLDPCCDGPRDSCHMPTRSKCSGVGTVCISQPMKDSNKCRSDPCSVGPRNSYHTPTQSKCSGASTICISQLPMNDSNKCCLDPCCAGSRDSCHMPTYAKSSRASSGPGGGSRLKRNNGTKLHNKNPSVLYRCPVHCRRGMESVKGNLENNSCRGKLRSAVKVHQKNLHDDTPGHTIFLESKQRSPGRHCSGMSKFSKGFLDDNSKLVPLSESRDHRDLCMIHNDMRRFSMKEKENANGAHEGTARLRHSSSGRTGLHNPVKNIRSSVQECSQIGGVRHHSSLTATENIAKEHAFVGKETRQPPGRYMAGNGSAVSEACTQTRQPHEPPSDHVDRAAAAARLAEEIEVMIADQLGKSNRRTRESKYLMSRRKLPEVQSESYGQTSLDVGIIAAANAVKKLKPVSLLPLVKRDEGDQRATPWKGPTSRAKRMAEIAIENDFYNQKELGEITTGRRQLLRHERAHFQTQSPMFLRKEHDEHTKFSFKGRSLSDLKNLANAHSELEKGRRSVRLQRSEEFRSFLDEPVSSYTPGSKRLRSATSPARDHSNKLVRLNVGKSQSQGDRMKQDQPLEALTNRMISSFGRWKPPPEEAQAKTTIKRKIFTTRKVRTPAWVERMSKAKDVFTSLIRPMLLAQSRKETQPKPIFHRKTLRPPGLMFGSSVASRQFGKHIPGSRAVQPNLSRIQRKNPVAPVQYDMRTGRKIVHSEREPGELLHMNQDEFPSFKSFHEKNTRITRRPIVKIGMIPSTVANSGRYHLKVKGWNADPLIRSDLPHKPADIIRYNRNGGLDVQVRRLDVDGKHKTFRGTSVGQRNVRQVTFAGMVVHNSRNERRPQGLRAPHSSNPLQTKVAKKKLITSQPRRVKSAVRKRRSSSATKIQPVQDRDKIHKYRGGGGQWTYHEGFWTETFKSGIEKVSQDDSLQNLITPGSMSHLGTPILELKDAQDTENEKLNKPAEKVGAEDFLTTLSSVSVNSVDDEDKMGNLAAQNISLEGEGGSQNPDLFKSLGFFGPDSLKGSGIIDHSSVVAMKGFLCPSRRNEEDERAKSCSGVELPKKQIQVSKIAFPNQERRKREPSSNEFPQSPLRLLDEVFPDSTENDVFLSMFDRLQDSTSIQIEAQSVEQCLASECITRQTSLDTLAHEQEGKLKIIELERTLMDIVLHTILQGDPLQDQEAFATRIEPISLPNHRRVGIRADKGVEAIVHSHDMSQSPLSKAVPCVDRSTERDIVPHVNRATELDVVPHVDKATELDRSSLFSKDQDCQTTNVEFLVRNIQRPSPPTQEKCSTKVHHQATECRAPWNTVGIQTPETTATISTTSLTPSGAMPMLMPVFFQQWGMNMLPTILPTFHSELPAQMTTTTDVAPPSASAVNRSFPVGVNQGTDPIELNSKGNSKEIAVQVHHEVSNLPINNRAAHGQLGVWEEESDSDWEELKGVSSPSTPSTPLSSPAHKISLKKAMELYLVNSSSIRETAFARKISQPSISDACQTLESVLAPPVEVVTETVIEDITADAPPQTMNANEMRRGTSWAKVEEMETATLALLRAASTKTPSATSSSEYSRESSPEFHAWISPGEVNIEEMGRSSTDGRFLKNVYNTRTFQEELGKQVKSHAWSSFGSGRASIGEISDPVRFLGLLSEGEVEAGLVSTVDEPGQIQNGYNFALHSRTDQGSEPGEFH